MPFTIYEDWYVSLSGVSDSQLHVLCATTWELRMLGDSASNRLAKNINLRLRLANRRTLFFKVTSPNGPTETTQGMRGWLPKGKTLEQYSKTPKSVYSPTTCTRPTTTSVYPNKHWDLRLVLSGFHFRRVRCKGCRSVGPSGLGIARRRAKLQYIRM